MSNTVLVDASSIAHANDNGAKLTVGSTQVQAVYGFLRSVRAMLNEYRGWNHVLLWDGRAQWRFDLYPQYKANRIAKTPEEEAEKAAYQKQVPIIRKMMQVLGMRQMLAQNAEADDLAGFLTRHLTSGDHRVVLKSGDSDWTQLVNPMCIWTDPIRDLRITHANFFEKTGYFSPKAFLEGKILIGDTTDFIEGVKGIGKKKAPEILAQFESVENFWRKVDSGEFTPKYVIHKNLASPEGRERFARNMKLMNLIDAPRPAASDLLKLTPSYNESHFRALCEKLNFRSVLRDFDTFVAPFKANAAH